MKNRQPLQHQPKMRAFVGAFAKAVDNLFIFALQMVYKHLALLVSFSAKKRLQNRTSGSCKT